MYDLLMLAMLISGSKHGYQLKRDTMSLVGRGKLHNNQIYPALRRFTQNRWVSKKLVAGQRGQTRHLYSLTARGRKELIAQLSRFSVEDAASAEAFRLRVGLFVLLRPDTRNRILDARESYLRARFTALTNVQKAPRGLDRYAGEVTAHVKVELESELDWITRLREISHTLKG